MESTVTAATVPAAAMGRTYAGVPTRAISMNIASPVPTATAAKKIYIRSAHIHHTATASIHIANTSRERSERRAPKN